MKRYAWRRMREGSPAAFSIPNRGAANELNLRSPVAAPVPPCGLLPAACSATDG